MGEKGAGVRERLGEKREGGPRERIDEKNIKDMQKQRSEGSRQRLDCREK